jgi:cytochrome c553
MKLRTATKAPRHATGWTVLAAALATAFASATLQAEEITLDAYGRALHVRADVMNGQRQFQRCKACHGPDGHGSGDGLVPAIAAQQFRVIVWQLIDYGQNKRWDVRMQSMVSGHDALSVQDIVDVAAFVSDLPPVAGGNTGNGQYAAHGAELFRRSCARCHGADAQGDDMQRTPKLAGQSYGYLLRQMHDAVEGRRPNFPPSHIRRLKSLEWNDLQGVADYLSRLPP